MSYRQCHMLYARLPPPNTTVTWHDGLIQSLLHYSFLKAVGVAFLRHNVPLLVDRED